MPRIRSLERVQAEREVHEVRAPQITTERAWLQPGSATPQDASGRPYGEMAGVSYRWWAREGMHQHRTRRRYGRLPRAGWRTSGDATTGALRGAVPTVTFGMRYRVSGETAVYADATSARALATDAAPGLYNTKVGMEWQPAKSRFGFENRSLGIQLQSGYRMSLRVKSGGLGVYFRGKF